MFSIPPYMVPSSTGVHVGVNSGFSLLTSSNGARGSHFACSIWSMIQSRSSTPELSGRAFVSGMAGFGMKRLSVPNILSLFSFRNVAGGGTSLYCGKQDSKQAVIIIFLRKITVDPYRVKH